MPELWAIDRRGLDVAFADEAELAPLRREFDAWAVGVPELAGRLIVRNRTSPQLTPVSPGRPTSESGFGGSDGTEVNLGGVRYRRTSGALVAGHAAKPGDVRFPAVDRGAVAGGARETFDVAKQCPLLGGIRVAADSIEALQESRDRQGLTPELVTQPLVERPDSTIQGERRGQQGRDRLGRIEPAFELAATLKVLQGAVERVDVVVERVARESRDSSRERRRLRSTIRSISPSSLSISTLA